MEIPKISHRRHSPRSVDDVELVISRCCFGEDGKEMDKDLKCTCTANVLFIEQFIWWRSRCRHRRGLLKKYLMETKPRNSFSYHGQRHRSLVRSTHTVVYSVPIHVECNWHLSNKVSADQHHVIISRLRLMAHQGHMFFFLIDRCPISSFLLYLDCLVPLT